MDSSYGTGGIFDVLTCRATKFIIVPAHSAPTCMPGLRSGNVSNGNLL